MRLCFAGFSAPIALSPDKISVLEIYNKALFARVCDSLYSHNGPDALEPYSWWDDSGEEIAPRNAALVTASPLALPWDDKRLASGLASKMNSLLLEDVGRQSDLEKRIAQVREGLQSLVFALQSDYSFAVDLEVKQLLKLFSFGVELNDDDSLLDKCIKFLSHVADADCLDTLVFVGFKPFFSEDELVQVYDHAFFHGLKLLLVENAPDYMARERETKYIVDQDFLECWPIS